MELKYPCPVFISHHKNEVNMGGQNFILAYLQACTGGKLALSECGPIWQFGVIAVLLVSTISVFIVLRIRAYAQSTRN